jgi:hypothetical protein
LAVCGDFAHKGFQLVIQNETSAQDQETLSRTIIVTAQQASLLFFAPSNYQMLHSSPHLLCSWAPQILMLSTCANHPLYAQIDVFGDKLLNVSSHSRTQSHDHITSVLADLATQHGLPTSIKNVPFADS